MRKENKVNHIWHMCASVSVLSRESLRHQARAWAPRENQAQGRSWQLSQGRVKEAVIKGISSNKSSRMKGGQIEESLSKVQQAHSIGFQSLQVSEETCWNTELMDSNSLTPSRWTYSSPPAWKPPKPQDSELFSSRNKIKQDKCLQSFKATFKRIELVPKTLGVL